MNHEPKWAGRIRAVMAEHNVSVGELACLVSRSQRTVVNWRRGTGAGPRPKDVEVMCAAYDVTSDWLLGIGA